MSTAAMPEAGIWKSFRAAWKSMFLIQLAVIAATLAIGAPLLGLAVKHAVATSGQAALSDTDLLSILTRPGPLALAFLIAGVALALEMLGYSAQLVAARAALRGETVELAAVLRRTAARLPRLVSLGLRFLAHISVIALPFLAAIATVAWVQLSQNDINYYLEARPPEFLLALALIVLLAIIMGVLVVRRTIGWFHALPLVLLRGESDRTARRLGAEHLKGSRRRIFLIVLLWAFGTPLLAGAFQIPWPWLAVRAATLLGEHVSLLALVLGLLLAVSVTISLLVHFTTLALLALFHVRLFRRAGLDPTEDPQTLPADGKTVPLKIAAAAGIFAILISTLISHRWLETLPIQDDAVVIAHRGASALAPENSLAAVTLAIEFGADWVEIDVQEIATGEVVVFHDRDFMRLARRPLEVADATPEDLAELDIGSAFNTGFSDQRVPTLRQVLEICRDRAGVIIELKYYGRERQLEQSVAEIVDELAMSDQVRIMSLSQPGLRRFAEIRPDWPLGLLSSVAIGNVTRLDYDFLALNSRAIDSRTLARAHRADTEVFAWTVNDPLVMSSLLSRGIDGLITDDPALARRLLAERELLNPAERLLVDLTARLGRTNATLSP